MTIDPTIWTNTIAKTKTINEDSEINSNKWLESVPKKDNDNLFKKTNEKATKKIRRKMAKAAALTATDMKAVMDVGAPS